MEEINLLSVLPKKKSMDEYKKFRYWIRVNLAVELFLKDALLHFFHNKDKDPSYKGLPEDASQLKTIMIKFKDEKGKELKKVIWKEQWDILCQFPTSKWDVTLITAVITNLPEEWGYFSQPIGGWKNISKK